MKAAPSVARLRELFALDASTGQLYRKTTSRRWHAGDPVGARQPSGYIHVLVDGERHRAHRVVWALVHGEWPAGEIDHINGIHDDNRPTNLRDVSRVVNQQNERVARRHNRSGFLGVHYRPEKCPTRPWVATIRVDGAKRHVGAFSTPDDAHRAYIEAKRLHHPGNTL